MVLGPNGAGKSTLLRLLAGLMRPTTGEVRVLGRSLMSSDPDARRPIGLLSHQSYLYDDLTLLENLVFVGRLYRVARPKERAIAVLDSLGLSERVNDLPRNLSRGMLQRAAIARALLHEPSVLLLDEPFTGLDAASGEQLRGLLRTQCLGGRAVVIVTHHPSEAWDLATRVGVLMRGVWASQMMRPDDLDGFLLHYQELARG